MSRGKMQFDGNRDLICECVEIGAIDEFHVGLSEEGLLVVSCEKCGASILFDGHIALPKSSMQITKEQADYWLNIAYNDIDDNNREGAWNIYRWLKELSAFEHAGKIQQYIKESASQ